jgi:hypothetical protein
MSRSLIYIGGYSRSGSTMLDIVLASHPLICGTGELSFLVDDWDHLDRQCTCGRPYSRCEFWKDLYPRGVPAQVRRAVRVVEARRHLVGLYRSTLPPHVVDTYRQSQRALFDYVRDRSGCPIVLDSSKCARATAGRAYALDRLAGQDVQFIHLVRDGLSTLRSYETHGSNWAAETHAPNRRAMILRAGVGWTITHATAEVLARQFGGRSMLLRYEDLVGNPLTAFAGLEALLGLDLRSIACDVASGAPFFPAHQVGGNRLRFQAPMRVKPASAVTGAPVARRHAIPFLVYGGLQQRRYGYPLFNQTAVRKRLDA